MSDLEQRLASGDQHALRATDERLQRLRRLARRCARDQEQDEQRATGRDLQEADRHATGRGCTRAGVIAAFAAALLVACAGAEPREPPAPLPVPEPPGLPPPRVCESIERVEVYKAARRLIATCASGARFETTVAVGRESVGPKTARGDRRTPEGAYRVAGPREASRFHGFIPIDYPSREDAQQALAAGMISRADFERIAAAHRRGEPPPADTPLGGEIGLHGEGTRWRGFSHDLDWTLGCLAVDDASFDFLAERLPVGAPFLILP